MKKVTKVVLVTGAVLAGVVGLAAFRPMGHWGGPNPEHMHKMMVHRMDAALDDVLATPQQRSRAVELREGVFVEMQRMHKENQAAKEELATQWNQEKPDAQRVHELVDERVDVLRALLHQVASGVLELHAAFTPEQRKVLAQRMAEHHGFEHP